MNIYEELIHKLQDNRQQVLVTKLREREGFIEEGLTHYLTDINQDNLKTGKDSTYEVLNKIEWDNKGEIHIREPFYPKERLIILGGGHIALPLAEFGAKTGFEVVVGDDRPSFANRKRFPFAKEVVSDSFENIIKKLKITMNDYIVIITRGHRHDMDCLRALLVSRESKYLGMIGSKRRVGAVLDILQEEGYDRGRLERIYTPIGLSIGAVTPEEISISILAELIQTKRYGYKGMKTTEGGDIDFYVLELLAKIREPLCIVTVIDTKGSTPRGVGAKMLVYPTGLVRGSIGGGCSEAEILHIAVSMIGTGRYKVHTIDMTGDVAESEGMVCGGMMEVLIEDWAPVFEKTFDN